MSALLQAEGLDLRFGAVRALDGVAISIWPGEVVAIVGESGSGKSSLLRVLAGMQRADAGGVLYRDAAGATHSVLDASDAALRNVDITLRAGECVALAGPSGAGKSTLMRCLYGNYGCDGGSIHLRHHGAMAKRLGFRLHRRTR